VIARAGLIGDVHCEAAALGAALSFLEREGVDVSLCVGDIVDGNGDPNHCVELLKNRAVLTVAGNHERWILSSSMRELPDAQPLSALDDDTVDWLSALPKTRRIETKAGPALLCHGLGADDMAGVRPDDEGYALESNFALEKLLVDRSERWIMNGHTHRRMARRLGELCIINAGTLHPGFEPCFALVDFADRHVRFFDVKNPGRIRELERLSLSFPGELRGERDVASELL
jgi:predicted phosphodiesterase